MQNSSINHPKIEINVIYENILSIIKFLGVSRPLLLPDLVLHYHRITGQDLIMEMLSHQFYSLELFLIKSKIFKLLIKNGQTYVYIIPNPWNNAEKIQVVQYSKPKQPKYSKFKKAQKRKANKNKKKRYFHKSTANGSGVKNNEIVSKHVGQTNKTVKPGVQQFDEKYCVKLQPPNSNNCVDTNGPQSNCSSGFPKKIKKRGPALRNTVACLKKPFKPKNFWEETYSRDNKFYRSIKMTQQIEGPLAHDFQNDLYIYEYPRCIEIDFRSYVTDV